jgi:dihydrofolate reductase
MKIAIDDMRDFKQIEVDIIIRSAEVAKSFLESLTDPIEVLYLDNDLGSDIEGWRLLDMLLEANKLPSRIILVTSNTVARDRMEGSLKQYEYHQVGQFTWKK